MEEMTVGEIAVKEAKENQTRKILRIAEETIKEVESQEEKEAVEKVIKKIENLLT